MVKLDDLTLTQKHVIIGSDRYSIRGTKVYDDIEHIFVDIDDLQRNKR